MKYNHAVKYKGEFYQTGADVPVEEENPEVKQEEIPEEPQGENTEVKAEPEPEVKEKPTKNK